MLGVSLLLQCVHMRTQIYTGSRTHKQHMHTHTHTLTLQAHALTLTSLQQECRWQKCMGRSCLQEDFLRAELMVLMARAAINARA
jgi:hypothetical protein